MRIKNPFEILDERLANIEGLLIELKHPETSKTETPTKTILDTDELGAKLGVTRPTISRWRKENRIPFIQVGSVIRYDLEKVLEALENKKRR
ncbi:helix-turn-helix domain-containing protein [Algoriphagus limi]|uniref:Helix-turn-helix domain-containing protein n=1 Tax=Algoriphagus limi TaxID=2975273 RepID=A0ABT2G911_9BACT|nr:helix-turn-helix domain-containing protein [Algoriphagus limi]MCS5491764.1 helix-turn-helix domain-containing protein [Algoriphagus limi]